MSLRTSLEEGIKPHWFAGILPEQLLTEAGGHCEAVVQSARRDRRERPRVDGLFLAGRHLRRREALLFSEQGVAGGPGYAAYLRGTDGSPAVRLGKGDAHSLSHDGRWAIATDLSTHTLTLLPTRTGQPRTIPSHGITAYSWAGFFPGDRRIIFAGAGNDGGTRAYVQDLDGGAPRADHTEWRRTRAEHRLTGWQMARCRFSGKRSALPC